MNREKVTDVRSIIDASPTIDARSTSKIKIVMMHVFWKSVVMHVFWKSVLYATETDVDFTKLHCTRYGFRGEIELTSVA